MWSIQRMPSITWRGSWVGARSGLRRKLGLDKPPLCISQLITVGHGMDLKLLRRCEIISSSL